jgi:hypothetical protein
MYPDCRISIQFDNRGSKVMSKDAETKIIAALAKHVFMVPASNVVRSTGMGQSSLVNHQVRGTTCTGAAASAHASLLQLLEGSTK